MPVIESIALGATAFRAFLGIGGVIFGMLQKDVTGVSLPESLANAVIGETQKSLLPGITGNLVTDSIKEIAAYSYKTFLKKIAGLDDANNLNHDIQRAVRKSQLTATFFAVEACLFEKTDLQNFDIKWFKAVKIWLRNEENNLAKLTPQISLDFNEVLDIFDIDSSFNPDEQQAIFIQKIKDEVLGEIRQTYIGEFSQDAFNLLSEKINGNWKDFTPSDEFITQLHLSKDRNLPDDKKQKDRWFWLMCSFFNEEYKTNERLKAAMLKNLGVENHKLLTTLTVVIGELGNAVSRIEKKQDEILELLKKIELQTNRAPFYSDYQALESKIKVDEIIKIKIKEKVFVGRENEYNRIENFINKEKSGYFVVKAKGGYGKTSLLAAWVNQRLHQNTINYGQRIFLAYHFFNQNDSATNLVNNAYTNLLRQLCIYQSKETFPSDIGRLRDTIIGLINEEKPSASEPLVIVIDALDEADEEVEPFGNLPEGVFVIVSARADENEEPPYLEKWFEAVGSFQDRILFLDKLPKEYVKKWLGIGKLNKFRLGEDAEFVESLYQKTKGFPLYLDYFIIDSQNKTVEQIKDSVPDLPEHFSRYIEKQYNALCRTLSDKWKEKVESLFGVLSISLGSLSKYDVKKLTGISESEIRGLPSAIWRWIRIQNKQNQSIFSFDHASLKEIFAKEIFLHERDEFLRKMSDYCAEWQIHQQYSNYGLRYYAEHLFQLRQDETLYQLGQDKVFLETLTKVFFNEPDIALKTLRTALRIAIISDNAIMMAEFGLKHAHQISNKVKATPFDFFEISAESAVSQAEMIYQSNPENGILWFLLIAEKLIYENRLSEAEKIIEKLVKRDLPKFSHIIWARFSSIIFLSLSAFYNEFTTILQKKLFQNDWVENWRDFFEKSDTEMVSAENWENLLNEAKEGEDEQEIAESLLWLAQDCAKAGKYVEALSLAREIKLTSWRNEALIRIAQKHIIKGNHLESENILAESLKPIENGEKQAAYTEALISLAKSYALQEKDEKSKEYFLKAFNFAQKLDYPYLVDEALISIAKAQAEIGNDAEALKISTEIIGNESYQKAIRLIAKMQAKAGKNLEALKTVSKIAVPRYKDKALISIVKIQARTGNYEEAIKTSRQITDNRDDALISIAEAQAKVGEKDLARKTAALIKDFWSRFKILDLIYGLDTEIDFPKLLGLANSTNDEWERARSLILIGELLAKAGRNQKAEIIFEEALAIAKTITNDRLMLAIFGSSLISMIAEAQARVGKDADAINTTRNAADESERAEIMLKITKQTIFIGKQEIALKILDSILINRNKYLPEIAHIFVEKGNKETFKKLFLPAVYYLDATYKMVGLLAELYPKQTNKLAEVLDRN